ncbi:MAG: hypothetical protein PWQ12_816 [Clostridiales bacterium]|jgi:hypothetical protein|nr:hypothetical protein [Clostridiales bacterium]
MKSIRNYLKYSSPVKKLSDLFFIAAVGVSFYLLISTYFIRRSLPAGVCPIDNRAEFFYAAIGLLVVAFILSFFDNAKEK